MNLQCKLCHDVDIQILHMNRNRIQCYIHHHNYLHNMYYIILNM